MSLETKIDSKYLIAPALLALFVACISYLGVKNDDESIISLLNIGYIALFATVLFQVTYMYFESLLKVKSTMVNAIALFLFYGLIFILLSIYFGYSMQEIYMRTVSFIYGVR